MYKNLCNILSMEILRDNFTSFSKAAVMFANHHYFDWTEAEQERYRAQIPKRDNFLIDKSLLRDLFSIEVESDEEVDDAIDNLEPHQLEKYNRHKQAIEGIGQDSFSLSEQLGDKTVLDFPTLGDYDLWDFEFQEASRKEDIKGYEEQPYQGNLFWSWARLIINDEFHYGFLTMASGYIISRTEEFALKYIQELVPHEIIRGSQHGKAEGSKLRFDLKIAANGKEEMVEELTERLFSDYLPSFYQRILAEWDAETRGETYIQRKTENGERHVIFIFSDKDTLTRIRFKNFVTDCETCEGDKTALDDVIDTGRENVKVYLDEQFEDVKANFDPKVAKLRRRNKVYMHPKAANAFDF